MAGHEVDVSSDNLQEEEELPMEGHTVEVSIDDSSSDEEQDEDHPVVARRTSSGADGSTIGVVDAWKAWHVRGWPFENQVNLLCFF